MRNHILELLKKKKIVVGALHFSPSPGFDGFDSTKNAFKRARADYDALIEGGVDAIIVENNYDLPHRIEVGSETVAFMTKLTSELIQRKQFSLGISVLWNDYRAALAIAKVINAQFIRVPAFVDSVKTSYGVAKAVGDRVKIYRHLIGADKVAIFADVHVKHAEMLDKSKTLEQSIHEAEKAGADGIIITGKWTGDAPILDDLIRAKKTTRLPILVGSGSTTENVSSLLKYADGLIVSTSLKTGSLTNQKNNPNLKSFEQRISRKKTMKLMKQVKIINRRVT